MKERRIIFLLFYKYIEIQINIHIYIIYIKYIHISNSYIKLLNADTIELMLMYFHPIYVCSAYL